MERVAVYTGRREARRGIGLFAEALLERDPLLPVEEEGRLNNLGLREVFIERIFAYRRLQALFQPRWTVADLIAFQAALKLQLMAHSPAAYRGPARLWRPPRGRIEAS